MRGLPPTPPDVLRFDAYCDTDGAPSSIGFYVLAAPGPPYDVGDLTTLLGLFILAVLDFVNQCSAGGTSVLTCRLRSTGIETWDIVEGCSPNHGAWTGNQANMVASVCHWLTGETGRGRQAVTWIPGFPDNFTDDHLHANDTCMHTVRFQANTFLAAIAAMSAGTILQCSLGTVHRSRHGAPLHVATFSPFVDVTASRVIGRCGRRMRVRR